MNERLPSLSALRAFEAAARHLSLTRAAEELKVTPAAISHQIKVLEDDLGIKLFDRRNRRLALTREARAGLGELRRGFDLVSEGVRHIRASRRRAMLRITVETTFAATWLVPRLAGFRHDHEDLDVLLDASDGLADFERDDVDIGIRWGGGSYRGLEAIALFEDRVFPVCHPSLIDGQPGLHEPADLARHTLLHLDWPKERGDWPDWAVWLDAAGVGDVDAERGLHFNVHSMALRAAVEGHGVALATDSLVMDDLKSGRLVKPFALSLDSDVQMYLVFRKDRAGEPAIAAFRDWIVAQTTETPMPASDPRRS
jgi:LysR family glycine cleavage system transcriptional activator